jgi:hypothetical protein
MLHDLIKYIGDRIQNGTMSPNPSKYANAVFCFLGTITEVNNSVDTRKARIAVTPKTFEARVQQRQ